MFGGSVCGGTVGEESAGGCPVGAVVLECECAGC